MLTNPSNANSYRPYAFVIRFMIIIIRNRFDVRSGVLGEKTDVYKVMLQRKT